MSQARAFAEAVQHILEAVMFENWLRFYFLTAKPAEAAAPPPAPPLAEEEEKLFIAVPEAGMQRIKEHYTHLLPLAEILNGQEITFETSRSAVCTYVVTEVDGKRVPRNMSDTVLDSATFQVEMQLFNTWVQAHEEQLDRAFMDFAMWKSLFAAWRATPEVQEWALRMSTATTQSAGQVSEGSEPGTVQ